MEWIDNDTLASAVFSDHTIELWSITTGQTKLQINTNQYVLSLKMLNNKIHLVASVGYGDIFIYNINDGNLVSTLKGHSYDIIDLIQISDDLIAGSGDGLVQIWNLTTNTCKFNLTEQGGGWIYGLKLITSNIFAGSTASTIKLWDITSGQLIRTLTGHTGTILNYIDLINSQTLVSGSEYGEIKLWNWATGECLSTKQTNLNFKLMFILNAYEQKNQQTTTSIFYIILYYKN